MSNKGSDNNVGSIEKISQTSDNNVATEEDIKVLKNIEKLRRIEFKHCVTDREMKAINNILTEREQMLREKQDDKQDIKDFQNALNEENLRCANYAIENNELKKRIQELEEEVNNSISIQNVIEAISVHQDCLLNQPVTSNPTLDANFRDRERYAIQVLQELLGGER